jgi:hypothetical protein
MLKMAFALGIAIIGCKPTLRKSTVKAVSSQEGTDSFILAPTRLIAEQKDSALFARSPVSGMLFQSLTLSLVSCSGPSARADAILIESLLASSGESLRRKGTKVFDLDGFTSTFA